MRSSARTHTHAGERKFLFFFFFSGCRQVIYFDWLKKKNVLKRIAFRAAPYGAACLAHFTWHFFWVSGTLPSYSFFFVFVFLLGLSPDTIRNHFFPLQEKKKCIKTPVWNQKTSKYIGDDPCAHNRGKARQSISNETLCCVDSFVLVGLSVYSIAVAGRFSEF